jgi:hypothetical protein
VGLGSPGELGPGWAAHPASVKAATVVARVALTDK